jgi:ELWxxDGT repeat protein
MLGIFSGWALCVTHCAFSQNNKEQAPSSSPNNLCVIGGKLLFTADDGIHGVELWASDGEPGHAHLVKDIWPESVASDPANFYVLGDRVLFVAKAIADVAGLKSWGSELWISDGTPEGTSFVKDVYPGPRSSPIRWMCQRDGVAYFEGTDGPYGDELWRTDGTPDGTSLLKDLWAGLDGSQPARGAAEWLPNGRFLFTGHKDAKNNLFISDGTDHGTKVIMDIEDDSHLELALNGNVLFSNRDKTHGVEPWISDGTAQGTSMLIDIAPGAKDSNPSSFTPFGAIGIFSAGDDARGAELWRTDGTSEGTKFVKDLYPGASSSNPYGFTVAGKYVYFVAVAPQMGREIWRTDGTPDGTILLKDINPGPAESEPYELCDLNGVLFFSARESEHGEELWRSDGTPEGTRLVKDIYLGETGSAPYRIVAMNDHVYFHAYTQANGVELWRSDGTEPGTILLDDIWKDYMSNPSSNPHELTDMNGTLFFVANDFEHGNELWRIDSSSGGAVLVRDIFSGPASSDPHDLTVVGGQLYFGADDGTNGDELWRTDGTPEGTAIVLDYAFGPQHSGPKNMVSYRGTVYFVSWRADDGEELRKVFDGSIKCVRDIAVKEASSNPRELVVVDDDLYFRANDGLHGEELWVTNGDDYNTHMVYDLLPQARIGATPHGLIPVESRLFFAANDYMHGVELWSLDSSDGAPRLVADIAGPHALTPMTVTETPTPRHSK